MSDIDFDELDKAVSSLMGGVGTDKADDAPKQKTLTISGTLEPGEDPAYTKLDEVARSIGNETLTTDDERTVDVDESSQEAASQSASESADSQSSQLSSPVQASVAAPPAAAEPPVVVLPPSPAVQRPATGRFMDVVHPSSAMRGTAALDTTPPIRSSSPQVATTGTAQIASDVPLTPFLPDAKVEKRPLGGSGAVPSPFDDSPTDVSSLAPEPKVEETTSINSEPSQNQTKDDLQPVLDASTYDQEGTAESAEIAAVESTEVAPEVAEPKSGSIASVESGDTEHLKNPQANQQGAIYDVENQPQALAHPTKQKSGWGTVIMIVIIIIIAAAIGAAAYFILGLGV